MKPNYNITGIKRNTDLEQSVKDVKAIRKAKLERDEAEKKKKKLKKGQGTVEATGTKYEME